MDDSTCGEVRAEVEALRARVKELVESLSAEVRTRRLVIVDADGFERVIGDSHGHYGSLAVRGRSPAGRSTVVELFANDPTDGDGANVGLSLVEGGNVAHLIDVTAGERPSTWTAMDD